MLLVQLMCLCAAGKVMYTSTCSPNSAAESLSHLTTAIGALVQDSPSSLRQLVQLCTQVCVIVWSRIVHCHLDSWSNSVPRYVVIVWSTSQQQSGPWSRIVPRHLDSWSNSVRRYVVLCGPVQHTNERP